MRGLRQIHVENLVKVTCIICYWKPIGAPHASETMARALCWDPIPVGALFGSSSLSPRVVDHLPLNSNSQVAEPLLAPQLHSAAELPAEN